VASLTAVLTTRRWSALLVAPVAVPLVLVLVRVLPSDGVGLAFRLAAAGACVLVVPGALVVRALGTRASVGVLAAAALAWSLGLVFLALALTFAVGGSLRVTIGVLAALTLVVLLAASRRGEVGRDSADGRAAAACVLGGAALGAAVWWWAGSVAGDGLFHLGRVRKLAELDALPSLEAVNEFRDGGLHPGYAFPLWHGALAVIARLAGGDSSEVVLYLPALLTPLALLVAYGAGAALFRSWIGGVAVALAQAAQFGFAREGIGVFEFLTLPATTAQVLLLPSLLALGLAYVRAGGAGLLAGVAAAAFVLAVVHPTYVLFAGLLLGGFLVGRLVLTHARGGDLRRIALVLGGVVLPSVLFLVWLLPVVQETASFQPSTTERARSLAHYESALDVSGDSFRFAPEAISRRGAAVVGGLLAVPLAVIASRRLWSAFVLGGSVLVLVVLLVPQLFTPFADAVSLSQARRLAAFLPTPFALAGAAVLLGRVRFVGLAVALGAGIVLQLLYPGEFTYEVVEGGPGWATWTAVFGGAAAILVGAVLRRAGPAPSVWAAGAAFAFVLPIAVGGLSGLRHDPPDENALTPGLVAALRRGTDFDDVVFGPLATTYRVAAYVPVYVAASQPAHVADTQENRPYERSRDVNRFFSPRTSAAERRTILAEYGADWLVVGRPDENLRLPPTVEQVFQDGRYTLFRVILDR
jgi:hypothetical protein